MAVYYLLQAVDSVTGETVVWRSANNSDVDYPGPNAATEVALLGENGDPAINVSPALFLSPLSDPAYVPGQLWYDDDEKAVVFDTGLDQHRQTLGRENTFLARNVTGATIADGAAVYINGVSGNRPTIALASTASPSDAVFGIATHSIENNSLGAVTYAGEANFNTSGFAVDDTLYLSATPGALSATPGTPSVRLAVALNSTPNGRILVVPPAAIPTSRTLTAGAGLTGGGDLSADRTFNVVAANPSITVNADSISVGVLQSDAQHGVRGGGTQHATATPLAAGFMSAADKTKLDGVETGAEVNTVDSVHGRVGAVVADASDYNASQIDNDSSVAGLFVDDALNNLATADAARVVGPASSTDNAIARFDGTTGKLLQNSNATISDAGVAQFAGFVGVGIAPAAAFHASVANPALRLEGTVGSFLLAQNATAGRSSLQHTSSSGAAELRFDPIPVDGTGSATVQLFVGTNTTGATTLFINRGTGGFSPNHTIAGNGSSTLAALVGDVTLGSGSNAADLLLPNTASKIGIGTMPVGGPDVAVHVRLVSDPEIRLEETAGSYLSLSNVLPAQSRVRHRSLTGQSILDLDAEPTVSTEASSVRVGRNTATTALAALQIMRANNTSAINHILSCNSDTELAREIGDVTFGSGSNNADIEGQSGAEIRSFGSLSLAERSSAVATNAGQGALWAKNTSNENQLAVTRGSGIVESIDSFSQETIVGTNPSGDVQTASKIARWEKKFAIIMDRSSSRNIDLPKVFGEVDPATFNGTDNSRPVLRVQVKATAFGTGSGTVSVAKVLTFGGDAANDGWDFDLSADIYATLGGTVVITGSSVSGTPRVNVAASGLGAGTGKTLVEIEAVAMS